MKSIRKKLVAILIIFSILILEVLPILSNISFAADNFGDNIEINVYFSDENVEKTTELEADVNNSNLKIYFKVNVKNNGYLRSGTFKIDELSNFSIKADNEIDIENNQIKLPDINKNQTVEFTVPIEYVRKGILTQDDLKRTNTITFSGAYVDEMGQNHLINKTIELKLAWNEELLSKVESELVKNIDYEVNGINRKIIQTKVKLYGNRENSIPIKNSEITISIPTLSGLILKDVKVEADKLLYTRRQRRF